MATYIGFSTINANQPYVPPVPGGTRPPRYGKKFRMVDEQLVIQDLINALNIRQGEKTGNPGYGTTLWSFIFEPNTTDTQQKIQDEVMRVVTLDPRLIFNSQRTSFSDHGILIEIELAIAPFNDAKILGVFFSALTNIATVQTT